MRSSLKNLMAKRYSIKGICCMVVEGNNWREACKKVKRILQHCGATFHAIDVAEEGVTVDEEVHE